MSVKHPIISVTGSSGAGTTSVKRTFERIFRREHINAAFIEGDAFHRYDRVDMKRVMAEEADKGNHHFSHFGLEANLLKELESVFRQFGESGEGQTRHYVHDDGEAESYGSPPGTFTDWEDLPKDTDVLLYEGLHGAMVTEECDVAQFADLLIGVVPIVNLEWIQKIHRDTLHRGYKETDVTATILRRMEDYVKHITPQFSRTDINFQRVPTVDTSNPFIARDVPTPDESFVVIRFRDPTKYDIDFPYLLAMLSSSFISRRNTIVVPGGKMLLAMELILMPILKRMMEESRSTTRLVA